MTVSLIVQPLQWEALPELHETPDLDDSDASCMADIRAVLERHGKLDRFALHLIHRHFDLAPGEVLIERPDPDARTQHVSVGRLDDEPLARPTTCILGPGGATSHCLCAPHPGQQSGCEMHASNKLPPPPSGPSPQPDRHRPDPPGPSWRPRRPRDEERER